MQHAAYPHTALQTDVRHRCRTIQSCDKTERHYNRKTVHEMDKTEINNGVY